MLTGLLSSCASPAAKCESEAARRASSSERRCSLQLGEGLLQLLVHPAQLGGELRLLGDVRQPQQRQPRPERVTRSETSPGPPSPRRTAISE